MVVLLEVSNFVCKHVLYGDVTITQENVTFLLDTDGILINKIADIDYRKELLEVLIPK